MATQADEQESGLGGSGQVNRVEISESFKSCLRHTLWGAEPALLVRRYIAIVRSRIEYASFLFCHLSRTQSLTLDRIRFKVLRLAMGYRTSTPTNVVLAKS